MLPAKNSLVKMWLTILFKIPSADSWLEISDKDWESLLSGEEKMKFLLLIERVAI